MKRQRPSRFRNAFISAGLLTACIGSAASAQDDIADIRSKKFTLENRKLQYFLIAKDGKLITPPDGYKLLIVLPGGDGGADFLPFVKRIYKHVLDDDYLVVQILSPKWKSSRQIVWPTSKDDAPGGIDIETFVAQAVADVDSRTRVDRRHVFTLSWSSGGPAAYAASLMENSPVTGSFVAMSIFKPDRLPELSAAKDKAYYILHSPDDQVCPYWMAKQARDQLEKNGAAVQFAEYAGGHGWRGNVFGNMQSGISWLEQHASEPSEEPAEAGGDE
jgi:predicted esterase